jgi:hypothetical protein
MKKTVWCSDARAHRGWFLDRLSDERKPWAQQKQVTRGGGRSWLVRDSDWSCLLTGRPDRVRQVLYCWVQSHVTSVLLEQRLRRHAAHCANGGGASHRRWPSPVLSKHPKSPFSYYCRISVHCPSTNTCAIALVDLFKKFCLCIRTSPLVPM